MPLTKQIFTKFIATKRHKFPHHKTKKASWPFALFLFCFGPVGVEAKTVLQKRGGQKNENWHSQLKFLNGRQRNHPAQTWCSIHSQRKKYESNPFHSWLPLYCHWLSQNSFFHRVIGVHNVENLTQNWMVVVLRASAGCVAIAIFYWSSQVVMANLTSPTYICSATCVVKIASPFSERSSINTSSGRRGKNAWNMFQHVSAQLSLRVSMMSLTVPMRDEQFANQFGKIHRKNAWIVWTKLPPRRVWMQKPSANQKIWFFNETMKNIDTTCNFRIPCTRVQSGIDSTNKRSKSKHI